MSVYQVVDFFEVVMKKNMEYYFLVKRNKHLFCLIKLMVLPRTEGLMSKESTLSCCNSGRLLLVCAGTTATVNPQILG